jgi:hypothetical protein
LPLFLANRKKHIVSVEEPDRAGKYTPRREEGESQGKKERYIIDVMGCRVVKR